MSIINVVTALNRLSITPARNIILRTVSTNNVLRFWTTPCLMAEPLKKKKRLDPAIVRAREERRKKKIEKQIRRLEKHARQLKPIDECEVPLSILDNRQQRQRSSPALSTNLLEQRALLEKEWANYKRNQHLADLKMLDRIAFGQQKALDELRQESEELYQEAIQFDFNLLPYKSEGPVETPPIDNYEVPDGDYQDISKKWE